MKNKILVIVPSRSAGTGRERNVDRFIEYWKQHTEGYSDICIALDTDDHHVYTKYEDILYSINENLRLVPKLNLVANQFINSYKYIAFFGDDHVIKTNWETDFINFFKSNNDIGIAYGNDLLQFEKMPTAVCITSNIIKELGYMVVPSLQHMYADIFWLDLGKALGCIKYFPNIIFEHCHPDNGKAVRDSQYHYAAAVVHADQIAYHNYINSGNFEHDVIKLNKLI
jgi:hypothetical protein